MHNYDEILQFLNDRAIYYIDCNGEQQPLDADILKGLKISITREKYRHIDDIVDKSIEDIIKRHSNIDVDVIVVKGESDGREN